MQKITKPASEVLRLDNVWVHYDDITALEDVNLFVYRSDFLGITGPNGGGKTTFLKVLLGLVKPSRGKVSIWGDSPKKNRKFIGYVPQHSQFDREFPVSVWDVVMTGRLGQVGLFRKYSEQDKKIAADVLKEVEMFALKDRQIGRLSGGQLQRVLIARALAANPKLLLFDEPAANIDKRSQTNLYSLLKRLNTQIPIVMVSHDMGVVSFYVNRIICLNRRLYYYNAKEITPELPEGLYHYPVIEPIAYNPGAYKYHQEVVSEQ